MEIRMQISNCDLSLHEGRSRPENPNGHLKMQRNEQTLIASILIPRYGNKYMVLKRRKN